MIKNEFTNASSASTVESDTGKDSRINWNEEIAIYGGEHANHIGRSDTERDSERSECANRARLT